LVNNNQTTTKDALHQRQSSFNQVQIWPWPQFSRNLCCINAVQIKSRVKLFNTEPPLTSDQILIVGSTRVMQQPHAPRSLPSLSRLTTCWNRVQV